MRDRLRDDRPVRQRQDDVALHQAFDHPLAGRSQDVGAGRVADACQKDLGSSTTIGCCLGCPAEGTETSDSGKVQGVAVIQDNGTGRLRTSAATRDRCCSPRQVDEVGRDRRGTAGIEPDGIENDVRLRVVILKLPKRTEKCEGNRLVRK
jgi:hypothetical protein